jgi:hypothetical protein
VVEPIPFEHLSADDDPDLWAVVLNAVLSDLEPEPDMTVEVGRCSHWLGPHKARWSADGGFAAPIGYGSGSGGYSFKSLPQFDWSVILQWTGEAWEPAKRQSVKPALRIAIPSRTTRHGQAAIHTLWMTGREKAARPYGFRKRDGAWRCTAVRW